MLAGVWHYAVKPSTKHSFLRSPNAEATITPQACDKPVVLETTPLPISNKSLVITETPLPAFNAAPAAEPRKALVTQSAPVVIQTIKPTPVIAHIEPAPVVIAPPPPAPVIAAVPPKAPPVIAPPPVPVIEEPPPVAKVVVRESIEFSNGSARLPLAATPRLLEIVELLKNDTRHLKIVGYTDNIGHPNDNRILSLKRAKAVMRFLVNAGVPAEHLTVEGAGADSPIDDNTTEEGRKRNRRIDITEQP